MMNMTPSEAELLCERCGGLKRMEVTIVFQECVPHAIRFDPQHIPEGYHLCPGHPTEPEHDGQLNARGDTRVSLDSTVAFESGCVHLENDWSDGISLVASEALSLLVWLRQQEPTLKRLVKEEPKG